ncbi:YcxB family protein [Acetivibrio mesophilus]|uniref:YcxB family protein n=1 Tax=Acetivibrio mesophilus TaxID=2487273 RepID=A0A4Q0I6Z4_9FIRM|nr:YcxB family protein [Acetivibrio mesophilus]RXE60120.1 YcxB family protein [Acetivibrio mesophilus]
MNSIKVNVKYRLKDFRDLYLATRYKGIMGKIGLIISFFLILIISLLVLITMIYILIEHEDTETILFLIFSIIFALGFFVLFRLAPFLLDYSIRKDKFANDRSLQILNCIEVTEEKITLSTSEGTNTFSWNDIYKVQELRPCFLIYFSPFKLLMIPKRCFASQEHLVDFRGILYSSSLNKRKLKLKNYKLKSSSPDYGEIELITQPVTEYFEVDNEENPEIVIDVTIEKKDLLITNFIVLYKNPIIIIITLLGLLFFISGILNLDSGINLATILLGAFFAFLLPIMLLINVNRMYNNDATLKKPFKYSFYTNHYTIDYSAGTNRVECANLEKIVEIKSSFLLYISPKLFHMIPKRVFAGKEDELEKFRQLIHKYRSYKSRPKI